jgi:hypothetical protein
LSVNCNSSLWVNQWTWANGKVGRAAEGAAPQALAAALLLTMQQLLFLPPHMSTAWLLVIKLPTSFAGAARFNPFKRRLQACLSGA